MRILIIETASVTAGTTIAHVRNCIEITNHLKSKGHYCEFIDVKTTALDVNIQYDIILFSAATFYFDFTKLDKLIKNQKKCRIGWMTNEFELFANGYTKDHMTFMINNFDEEGIKKAHRHDQLLTTNLNTLMARPRNEKIEKKYDLCYWGTYRKYRIKYFEKYFDDRMLLSTSTKNIKKFQDIDVHCMVTDKLSWEEGNESLNFVKASIYIEDSKTHGWFNYMANRFFEALFCNTAMFFDVSCQNTIDKDIYHIDPYFIVDGPDELEERINNLDMDLVEEFLAINSQVALGAKRKTLFEIESFLKRLAQ